MTKQASTAAQTRLGGFLAYAARQQEARETIQAMLAPPADITPWRGILAVPPGSPMDKLLGVFHDETDIPLELPFFAVLHFVSGLLLSKRVKIQGACVDVYPDLWTIVLAPSGAGKTMAHNLIAKAAPVKSSFPEVASGARFIEAFQQHNFGLWFQDEFAQKLKQIETPNSPLADVKEYLLRAYGYDKIERSTKKETITIEEPCLGILGLNTPESFFKALSPESLLDGFAARFAYVIAERDPARPMLDFPLYNIERLTQAAQVAFDKIQALPLPAAYLVGAEAETAFRESFRLLCSGEIPEAFYRRILFRAFKYATLYHVILGKASDTLDAEDMGWAARVSSLHLSDMRRIAEQHGLLGDALKVVRKVRRLRTLGSKPLTARFIQQRVRGVQSADEARALVGLVN